MTPDEATSGAGELTTEFVAAPFRLSYAALSDVGRVRKDNQDSGYAGPWLLSVCDGVGGAARGDLASSTVLSTLIALDRPPVGDLLAKVAASLQQGHAALTELISARPALAGTSTTAVVALFDGHQLAFGHVGDSRAYLLRGGALTQLTHDHTFVQTLIDEGRITEEESHSHPHRNLILRAVDGTHELEPDLFLVDLALGDRVLLCSDGASGSLDSARLVDILSSGTADYAVTELVRASLEAGSTDNVTCIVADVVPTEDHRATTDPVTVGAAAETAEAARERRTRGFRGHRSGDTGELPPVALPEGVLPEGASRAIVADPIDPEELRYAPRPPRRFLWLRRGLATLMVLGAGWVAAAGAWSWTQAQFYVGVYDEHVAIYRGVSASLPGVRLHSVYETTDLAVVDLADSDATKVSAGLATDNLDDARRTVDGIARLATKE